MEPLHLIPPFDGAPRNLLGYVDLDFTISAGDEAWQYLEAHGRFELGVIDRTPVLRLFRFPYGPHAHRPRRHLVFMFSDDLVNEMEDHLGYMHHDALQDLLPEDGYGCDYAYDLAAEIAAQ